MSNDIRIGGLSDFITDLLAAKLTHCGYNDSAGLSSFLFFDRYQRRYVTDLINETHLLYIVYISLPCDRSRGVGVLPPLICVSVYPHDISKTDTAGITKLDAKMFQDKSWKPIYFGIKRSEVQVTSHKKNSAGVGLCTLVSAGFL